jgi:hypothetical protein
MDEVKHLIKDDKPAKVAPGRAPKRGQAVAHPALSREGKIIVWSSGPRRR